MAIPPSHRNGYPSAHESCFLPPYFTTPLSTTRSQGPVSVSTRRFNSARSSFTHRGRKQFSSGNTPTSLPSRATIRMTATVTDPELTASAPHSVLNSNPVIVGGGPVGLLTAILLNQRCIPVTIIEQEKDFNSFRVPRQYFLVIFKKGRRALKCVPGLWETITKNGFVFNDAKIVFYKPDGSRKTIEWSLHTEEVVSNVRLSRPSLVCILKDYITEHCEHVTTMFGTSVRHIAPQEDGVMELILDGDKEETVLRSRLVLACDGKNSVIAKGLFEAECASGKRLVHSPHGLHVVARDSPAVGLKIKAVLLDRKYIENLKIGRPESDPSSSLNIIVGKKKGPPISSFNFGVFPVSAMDVDAMGGYLASMPRRPDHDLWALSNVEDAFKMFEENFPQIDIRKCITPENMKEFIDCKPTTFGYVSRRNSLVADIGLERSGGVVLLGDAAHSFPPDIGQGVSTGLEDARLFAEVLDKCGEDCGLHDVLQLYEQKRDDDISALMKIAQVAYPYQYGQNKFRSLLHNVNVLVRRQLSNSFPGLMYPAMISMVGDDLPFREIARRADKTTAVLITGVISSLTVVATAAFLAMQRI